MDILAHVLWAWALLRRSGKFWLVAASAALPDLISFGPHLAGSLFNGTLAPGKPELHTLSPYVFTSYSLTHSVIVCAVVLGFISVIRKSVPLWLWGWPLHILIDIPTHSMEYFPTPFLWPLSDYRFDGMSWATPWFIILNYSALAITYIWIYTRNGTTTPPRRRKAKA